MKRTYSENLCTTYLIATLMVGGVAGAIPYETGQWPVILWLWFTLYAAAFYIGRKLGRTLEAEIRQAVRLQTRVWFCVKEVAKIGEPGRVCLVEVGTEAPPDIPGYKPWVEFYPALTNEAP